MRVVYGGSVAGTTRIDGQDLREPRERQQPQQQSQQKQRPDSDRNVRRINGHRIRFSELAAMAFPNKTEANLAFLARVDPRTARRWLGEHSEPPAEALGLILCEIMRRYHQRD
jgi:hypothetical protein